MESLETWSLYYPVEEYTEFNGDVDRVFRIMNVMESTKLSSLDDSLVENIMHTGVYKCDYKWYISYDSSITCISCAVSELIYKKTGVKRIVQTRIVGMVCAMSFDCLDTNSVGKLVGLRGTVSRVGHRRIESLQCVFECVKCGKIKHQRMVGNIYRVPVCGCKSKSMVFLQGHPDNSCVDRQEIRIQECSGMTKNVTVELSGLFVGVVAPGDMVDVIGVVVSEQMGEAYKLKVDCNNLIALREDLHEIEKIEDGRLDSINDLGGNCDGDGDGIDNTPNANTTNTPNTTPHTNTPTTTPHTITNTNFQLFKTISEEEHLVDILANAFFSEIVGHSNIKTGLVLALFGGTKKFLGVKPVRSEIHTLIVGDPGLGKSKILLAASAILPKSTFVSGCFCTTAGLTVAITHDPCSGEYMADAGALVVSDGGICCIDEFDKLDDHSALLEAMEDQVVTVAKGGIVCEVPARPTILAAANPRSGHFDKSKTIKDNLKFDSALLSRFDLIYILMDDLSEKEDFGVFNKILTNQLTKLGDKGDKQVTKGDKQVTKGDKQVTKGDEQVTKGDEQVTKGDEQVTKGDEQVTNPGAKCDEQVTNSGAKGDNNTVEPHNNIVEPCNNTVEPYKHNILRAYVEYARNTVHPILSNASRKCLRDYYLSIRSSKGITVRNLESLIRLTESVAKMQLKTLATAGHARYAISLYKNILIKDEESKKKKATVDDLLREYVQCRGVFIEKENLINLLEESQIKKNPIDYLEILNCKGIVLKLANGKYKILIK